MGPTGTVGRNGSCTVANATAKPLIIALPVTKACRGSRLRVASSNPREFDRAVDAGATKRAD